MKLSSENEFMLKQIEEIVKANTQENYTGMHCTLKSYIVDTYIPYFTEKHVQHKTIKSDLIRLKIISSSPFSEKNIASITLSDSELFFVYLANTRKVCRATINRYRSRLLAIFNHAMRNRVIKENVITLSQRYKEANRTVVLSDNEIQKLLIAAQNSRNKELYIIMSIAFNTGMRKSEILSLRKRDIVDNSIVISACNAKSGYSRIVPINDALFQLISEYIKDISDLNSNLFSYSDIRGSFDNAVKKSKVNKCRFHDIRRTCATHLKDKDVSIYDIKDILGHCNTTMTERYLTSNIDRLHRAINKIAYV